MIFKAEASNGWHGELLGRNDKNLKETTILVTGSTGGFGRPVAQELAAVGATVLLHGRSPGRFEATREARANRQAHDSRVRNRLWVLSEQLCGPLLEPVVCW